MQPAVYNEENNSEDDNSDSDLDVDLYINVSKVDQCQAHEMNRHGLFFGMSSNDFYSFLTDDMEEAESNRLAREEEHEKALFSGRKSRRERRYKHFFNIVKNVYYYNLHTPWNVCTSY